MQTTWTRPKEGSTLGELAAFFPKHEKLQALAESYDKDTKVGLLIIPDGSPNEYDEVRTSSEVVEERAIDWSKSKPGHRQTDFGQPPMET